MTKKIQGKEMNPVQEERFEKKSHMSGEKGQAERRSRCEGGRR